MDIDVDRVLARAAGRIDEIAFRGGEATTVYEVLRAEDLRRFGRRRGAVLGLSVAVASYVLGIDPPEVRLLRHSNGDEQAMQKALDGTGSVVVTDLTIGGYARREDRTIGIDLNQTRRRVMRTTAHEVRHVWQFDTGKQLGKKETDADAFADVFMDLFENAVMRKAHKLVPPEPRHSPGSRGHGSAYHTRCG